MEAPCSKQGQRERVALMRVQTGLQVGPGAAGQWRGKTMMQQCGGAAT